MLEPQTLRFLSKLRKNNNKQWFDTHREEYEAARIDFSNFIQLVIDDLQRTDTTITGLTSKDCLFRLNRDIRFSKDKTPYKTNFGASIKRGGKKSPYAGYYFHLEPGSSFAGGGLWMPDAASLKKIRQEIDYNFDEFHSILTNKTFKKVYNGLYESPELKLITMPKGYDTHNPAIEYLKFKSFIAERAVEDSELTTGSIHKRTVEAYLALKPLLDFMNRALD